MKMRNVYTPKTHPVIAIDLDSTIWTEDFPNFGEPFPHAIETLNAMYEAGYEVIIWTSRGGENLELCMKHLREKYGLNPSIVANQHAKYFTDRFPVSSPKIGASMYLDDKAYGAPPSFKHEWKHIGRNFLGEGYLRNLVKY